MIDIARNIVPCSDKQDMKSRNGSYFQPSFSTRKRQRISSDLFSELPQKRSKTTNGRIWTKATYSFSSQTLCTISSKVIRMWASFSIFAAVRKPHIWMRCPPCLRSCQWKNRTLQHGASCVDRHPMCGDHHPVSSLRGR